MAVGIRDDSPPLAIAVIGIPVFLINLPALPLVFCYSLIGDDSMSKLAVVAMWTSEILMSSLVWGYVASRRERRTSGGPQKLQGFPLD